MYEKTPEQLLNEIRAFVDHEARCFVTEATSKQIEQELNRAEGHLTRIILDCFKYLNVKQNKKYVERFNRTHYFTNLNLVDSGNFIVKYHALVKVSQDFVRDAKACESHDKDTSLDLYQKAYNSYSELQELVESSRRQIAWATAKSVLSKILSFFVGVIATVIIGLIVYGLEKHGLIKFYELIWFKISPPNDVVIPTSESLSLMILQFLF